MQSQYQRSQCASSTSSIAVEAFIALLNDPIITFTEAAYDEED